MFLIGVVHYSGDTPDPYIDRLVEIDHPTIVRGFVVQYAEPVPWADLGGYIHIVLRYVPESAPG